MHRLSRFRQQLYLRLLKPVGTNTETYRREFITNIMVASLSVIASLTFLLSIRYELFAADSMDVVSIVANAIFLSVLLVGWRLSRRGHYVVVASIIVSLLVLATLQLTLAYGFELPIALLLFALSIVVTGILLRTRAALITTGLLTLVLLVIAYAQVTKRLHPNLDWQDLGFQTEDAIGFTAILSIISIVSWLANREIDRALRRALRSEIDLEAERDGLEIKVLERTRELEETQLLRTMELQRFAEFGRLSANLLHEVANPLTAASLNLEQFTGRKSQVIEQARQNINHIERYVRAARKQLQHESSQIRFSVKTELEQITNLILPLARTNQVKINIRQTSNYWLYGDPVHFNQLLGNLLVNAIDAYEAVGESLGPKIIEVSVTADAKVVIITVKDWGTGISKLQLTKVFEQFYTTKSSTSRGMGIGLAMVKRFVEVDFSGSISVTSSAKAGTVFTLELKRDTTDDQRHFISKNKKVTID